MFRFLVALLAASANAFVIVVRARSSKPHSTARKLIWPLVCSQVSQRPIAVAKTRVPPPALNFFDDIQASFQKMMQPPPSIEDAELFCAAYDDESTGCTAEMLEVLAKRKAPKVPVVKPRWSKEIDDAVFKPE